MTVLFLVQQRQYGVCHPAPELTPYDMLTRHVSCACKRYPASITASATRGSLLEPTARRSGPRGAGGISTDSLLNETSESPGPVEGGLAHLSSNGCIQPISEHWHLMTDALLED